MEKLKALTEKTLIPISAVMALLGGVAWLTTFYTQFQASASEIKELKEQRRSDSADLQSIKDTLIEIKTELKLRKACH